MRKRVTLIANPVSGGNARPRIKAARRCLEQAGAQVALRLTGQRGDAATIAAGLTAADCDLVIAGGGDGTLNEVANGLAGRGIPLAFLPLGTVNVMALEMGIPFALEAACAIALHGEARPVAVGEANGSRFLMMAGAGYDAATVRGVSSRLKRYTGKFAYMVSGVLTLLRYRPEPLRLTTAEGQSLTAWHVVISNISRYGGRHIIAPAERLDQPQLTACLVVRPGRWQLLRFWLRIMLGLRWLGPITRVRSSAFEISGATVPVQLDGDDHGDTPLTVRSRGDLLELIFPLPD